MSDPVPATVASGGSGSADGRKHSDRRSRRAVWLILPMLALMLVFYLIPLGATLYRSVDNSSVTTILDRTSQALASWQGQGTPDESIFAALHADLTEARADRTLAVAARRLNFSRVGFHSLLTNTGRRLGDVSGPQWDAAFISIDERWGDPAYWTTLKRELRNPTATYLLAALDLKYDDDGRIIAVDEAAAVYGQILWRTVYISLVVTGLTLVLGLPTAYFLANGSPRLRASLLSALMLVFWTSLLVRSLAWIVILQREGLVNTTLVTLGVTEMPFDLIYSRGAVYIAMTHVLLPFMILPIFSAMVAVPSSYMRAAYSLGGGPVRSFVKVYLPQVAPGIGAGSLLVFIQALGYYITPALVGGPRDQMISYFVAFFVNEQVDWNMAAALAVVLLVLISGTYLALGRRLRLTSTTITG